LFAKEIEKLFSKPITELPYLHVRQTDKQASRPTQRQTGRLTDR